MPAPCSLGNFCRVGKFCRAARGLYLRNSSFKTPWQSRPIGGAAGGSPRPGTVRAVEDDGFFDHETKRAGERDEILNDAKMDIRRVVPGMGEKRHGLCRSQSRRN